MALDKQILTEVDVAQRMTSGVTVDCPCGATAVPMAWGAGDGSVRLYRHRSGLPYGGKVHSGDCGGPRDLFAFLLRENKLMMMDVGTRAMTQTEQNAYANRGLAELEGSL